MRTDWHKLVIKNFDAASYQYNNGAFLQKVFAQKLADQCKKRNLLPGIWIDLGSGTGLLANELEKQTCNQDVIRIDGSENMLRQHHQNKSTILFDLNFGLPKLKKSPTLIASNFALHWLDEPEQKLKEWFSAFAPGGWLAIALPIQGSFLEWHNAARQASVECTAMKFPSKDSLLNMLPQKSIQYQTLESFTQEAPKISSLLKPLVNIGAQTSKSQSLTITEWRRLEKSWITSKPTKLLQLTWLIQILLAQK